jgi:tRNA(Ile)-lysidine synthase
MLDKIEMILSKECRLDKAGLYLVGVSGGPDSICLLHCLYQRGYHLMAVHINHGLRPEADQEEQIVQGLVKSLGLVFFSNRVNVLLYASEHSLSIEEAARCLRYQCLFEQAEKSGAAGVIVAHHANDQVETILMHLLRGSGLAGLRGMDYLTLPNPWSESIPLIRPLISTWHDEIMAYLSEQNLTYLSDQSNYDTTFFRNRLRHELLPTLETYNPRIGENLLRMSRISQADYDFISREVAKAWQLIFARQGPGYLAFRLAGFHTLHPSIQRYLLRKAIAIFLPSLRDIDYESIERGINFLEGPKPSGQVDLISGLRIIKEDELFWLATWQTDLPGVDFPAVPQGAGIILVIPSIIPLDAGWMLRVVQEADTAWAIQQSAVNPDPFQAWLDLDDLVLPLIFRRRKQGERIQPLGMHGHSMKISDLMVNLKMPRRARSGWPLLYSGKDVVWMPGYRQSHLGRVKPTSQRIVHLSLARFSEV